MENRLEKELGRLCREYAACSVEVERRDEARKVKNALENVCGRARQRQDISDPALLIALLDAYEVTRDEVMLQEVLDVVSRNLDRLLTSSMRTPKPIIKQWCDPLMTFHKHCSCYSLLTLR